MSRRKFGSRSLEDTQANDVRYACDSLRILSINNLETPDYIKKVDAFFEYAKRDPDMVS